MLTYQECLDMCDLTPDEIDAIARHEHIPELVAAELGNYLTHSEGGIPCLERFILEDIEEAERRGHHDQVVHLKLVLRHFIETHPEHRAEAS
ncbi:MAG: hypothetical protein R3202_02775 [Candidatus Competibacterales bacterium]|nr:hypothetical protein [Candidatus Competibacterales bacterium]